jgi:hypothetical protein
MDQRNQPVELIIANKELALQIKQKEKHVEELIVAKKELVFQNKEKKKRAAELISANKELAFQNKEKEKRAAELIIANHELAFQNKEKEKRAAELIIANHELEKADEYLKEYIKGLEGMMFITSHKVRQPICNILGIASILDSFLNSPDKLLESVNYIKKSALDLDTFTKELTLFISDLEHKGKIKNLPEDHESSSI